VEISCDLGIGAGKGAVLATDLGHGYIDENRTTS
jgi:N-acetylglutamate synthase/N-acetylornithine aminotransferase